MTETASASAANTRTWQARDIDSLLHPFTHLGQHQSKGPLVIEQGDGACVLDDAGNRYIEAMAGLWCTSLGFSNERLAEAAYRQMRTLPFSHQFASRSHQPGIELAERLVAMAPDNMARVFFTNSGSEANDTQLKLVRYYHKALGKPEKRKVIARQRGYHGVTLATASLTGLPYVHAGFELPIEGMLHTNSPHYYREHKEGESVAGFVARCAEDLQRLILEEGPETIGAFIAEPVLAAGGVIIPPEGYYAAIQPVLDKYDVLLIADEVVNGFGRTGNMWGSETMGLRPDLMSIAKQLSSAYLPIAACLISDKVHDVLLRASGEFGVFGHGYTYSGHPVCCAVALETLNIYQEMDVLARVRALQPQFERRAQALNDAPLVGDARAIGLIGGAELMADGPGRVPFAPLGTVGARVVAAALKRGVILRAIQDTVAFCPPYIIDEAQIDTVFDVLEESLAEVASEMEKEAA